MLFLAGADQIAEGIEVHFFPLVELPAGKQAVREVIERRDLIDSMWPRGLQADPPCPPLLRGGATGCAAKADASGLESHTSHLHRLFFGNSRECRLAVSQVYSRYAEFRRANFLRL